MTVSPTRPWRRWSSFARGVRTNLGGAARRHPVVAGVRDGGTLTRPFACVSGAGGIAAHGFADGARHHDFVFVHRAGAPIEGAEPLQQRPSPEGPALALLRIAAGDPRLIPENLENAA